MVKRAFQSSGIYALTLVLHSCSNYTYNACLNLEVNIVTISFLSASNVQIELEQFLAGRHNHSLVSDLSLLRRPLLPC